MSLYSIKEWTRVKALGSEYVELVHNATNEEKWGPTGEQMEEVCRVFPRGAREIMDEIRHRLKHRGDAWRPCYKSLLLLDYLVRNCANAYLPQITPILPLLREISTSFYYTNSKGVDHGVSVRERARNLSNLMNDGVLLREEREKASQTKAKLARDAGAGNRVTSTGLYSGSGYGDRNTFRESPSGGSRGFPSPPRTKEQQEKYDRQVALRLQYEEERASGRSAVDSFEAFEAKHMRQKQRSQRVAAQANDADEELARRLQEEEEDRARRTGGTLPSLRSDQPGATSSATPTPAPLAPEPAAPAAKENVLDDLFAAPPAPQAQPVSQGPLDPFAAPPASAQWGGHPGAPPAQQGWGQPAQAAPTSWDQAPAQSWGQPAATAPPPHDAWQTAPQPPAQQPWGQPAAAAPPAPGAWQSAPQPPAPQSWGQPAAVPPPAHDAWQSAPQPPAPQQWGQAPTGPSPWGAPQTNGAAHGSQGYPQGDLFSAPPPAQPTTAPTNDMWASMEQFTAQQQRKRP